MLYFALTVGVLLRWEWVLFEIPDAPLLPPVLTGCVVAGELLNICEPCCITVRTSGLNEMSTRQLWCGFLL